VWQEHKLGIWVNEFFDEPWAGNSIDFNFLAADPFHKPHSCFVADWLWCAVIAAVLPNSGVCAEFRASFQ
jgi:hypothetical protein